MRVQLSATKRFSHSICYMWKYLHLYEIHASKGANSHPALQSIYLSYDILNVNQKSIMLHDGGVCATCMGCNWVISIIMVCIHVVCKISVFHAVLLPDECCFRSDLCDCAGSKIWNYFISCPKGEKRLKTLNFTCLPSQ